MRGNKRADTKPEIQLRSLLHASGLRFRKDHRVDIEGRVVRPDIVFTRQKVAVFVDGCFWHVCPEHGRVPGGQNADYWQAKLEGNVVRDEADTRAMKDSGWTVIRIWEHEGVDIAAKRVMGTLG